MSDTTASTSSRRGKLVGLALSDRSLTAAEVASGDGELHVLRAATFSFPQGTGLESAEALGGLLGEFLKQHGFTARSAIVGIPARWVLSKTKEVPPADDATVAESLRLQAEGEFSADLKELTFDYAGAASPTEARTVLLMAVPREQIEQVSALVAAAGLKAQAVMPTAAALSSVTARAESGSSAVLSLVPGGLEFAAQQGLYARALRHLGSPSAPAPLLAAEFRRAAASVPAVPGEHGNGSYAPGSNGSNGSSNGANGDTPHRSVVLWDGAALPNPARLALGQAGIHLADGDPAALGVRIAPGIARAELSAAAVALAVVGLSEERPQVNFLAPRLAPPKPASPLRRNVLIGAAAGMVLLLVLLAVVDMLSLQSRIDQLQAKVTREAPKAKLAEAEVKRISYAERWHAGNPTFLACLRDLTVAIPDDQQTYVINFNLHDNMKGVVSGKTGRKESVLKLVDEMNRTKRFSEVKMSLDTREAREGGRSRTEVTFTLTFNYLPTGGEPAKATK